jgi:hypothetical protein
LSGDLNEKIQNTMVIPSGGPKDSSGAYGQIRRISENKTI